MSGSLILNCIQTCVVLGGEPNIGRKPAVTAPKEWTVGLVRENNIGLTGLDVGIHVFEWVSEIIAKTLIDHCTPNDLYVATKRHWGPCRHQNLHKQVVNRTIDRLTILGFCQINLTAHGYLLPSPLQEKATAAKTKAAAAKSHGQSSSDKFDQDAEMRKVEEMISEKGTGQKGHWAQRI